jgi:hypothetical protein
VCPGGEDRLHGPFFVSWPGNFLHIGDGNLVSGDGGFHGTVGINPGGTAEWFARAANGTLVHDYQDPSGNDGWSGVSPVGNSPSNIAGNPSVVSDQAGYLEVFARNSSNEDAGLQSPDRAHLPCQFGLGRLVQPGRELLATLLS